ncbi:MAG: aldolase [Aquificota bacterium]|nr:aldolase [Aquificota bacterium]
MRWIVEEFRLVGKSLFREGLVSGRAGNLSYAWKDRLIITRTGSFLGNLTDRDLVEVPLKKGSVLDERASVELPVHRRVILETGKRAVVHAHPPCAVSLSLFEKTIDPVDSEGKVILGEVPVLDPEKPSASEELARAVAEALRDHKVVVIKGHGAFAADMSLMRAYSYISTLEHSCRIRILSRI